VRWLPRAWSRRSRGLALSSFLARTPYSGYMSGLWQSRMFLGVPEGPIQSGRRAKGQSPQVWSLPWQKEQYKYPAILGHPYSFHVKEIFRKLAFQSSNMIGFVMNGLHQTPYWKFGTLPCFIL
jgi:hypothetical protein